MTLLVQELSAYFSSMAAGSIVVASSDVMLDIAAPGCSRACLDDAVTIVTVPEALRTAQNHVI